MVSNVSAGTGGPPRGEHGLDSASRLFAQHDGPGGPDVGALADAVKARAEGDPKGAAELQSQIEARLSPVDQGAFARSLGQQSSSGFVPLGRAEATPRTSVKVETFKDADAFNEAANDAAPNTRYEYKDYSYTTDGDGRVIIAEGEISLDPTGRNDPDLQAAIGHEGKKTDIGFHLIGDRFGGQTNRLNVVPGNGKPIGDGEPNLNNGAYKQFENTVAELAEDHKVEMRIEPEYNKSNDSNRPDRFEASYRVDGGAWMTQSFVNK
jgi:hypothetical protein